jgi:hypothetical protein
MLRRGNYRPVRGRVRKLIVLESGQATGVAALAEMSPDAIRQKKKGRSGHERPKSREETPKEGYDIHEPGP